MKKNTKLMATLVAILGGVLSLVWLLFLEHRIFNPTPLISFLLFVLPITITVCSIAIIILIIVNHIKKITWIVVLVLFLIPLIIASHTGFAIIVFYHSWTVFDWAYHAILLSPTFLAYILAAVFLVIKIFSKENKFVEKDGRNNENN